MCELKSGANTTSSRSIVVVAITIVVDISETGSPVNTNFTLFLYLIL
nr:MAG TPA: hypothetical protein [Caudoviricetes sp.]